MEPVGQLTLGSMTMFAIVCLPVLGVRHLWLVWKRRRSPYR